VSLAMFGICYLFGEILPTCVKVLSFGCVVLKFSLPMLELCTWTRSPEGKLDDLRDQVTSIAGGQSFAFRVADALELHRPDRGNKENPSV